MNMKELFEVQTNDCGNPTFIMDYDTEEILHMNQAMEKKFKIFQDYAGRKASQVIPHFETMRGYDHKTSLAEGVLYEKTVSSPVLSGNYRAKSTIWEICGRKFVQTKYFLAPSTEKRKTAEHLFEKAIAMCLEILGDTTITSPVESFLELLGKFYASEQVYICEFDTENNRLVNRYVWSKDPENTQYPETNTAVELDGLMTWLEADYSKSIINVDQTQFLYGDGEKNEAILKKNNFKNLTMSKLWNKDGSMMGILGLNNRQEQMYDDRLLQAISHFVMDQFNRKSMVEALEDFNDVDLLTGFFNRKKYGEKLEALQENPPESLGVLVVTMNGLRETNEYLGYEKGDAQIKRTSSLLVEYFNSNFFRTSGDEFIGFVEDCAKEIFQETVDSLQMRLKQSRREPTFSFGHSWEEGTYDIAGLVKVADAVMLINKQAYYHDSYQDIEKVADGMLQDLFHGLAQKEFLIYLQPQVDLNTESVVGAEALIRRYDKKKDKMVYPDKFIPLYEENAIIRHIDLFVVEETCKLLQIWMKTQQEIPISVNLSRVTLLEHGIVDTISGICDRYGVNHSLIIIEVTERMGIVENEVASSLVDEFKAKGFKLSLDDFGCAYSNIVTLATISVDEVKLDKSLVDNILTNPKNAVIVESMLSMCLNLDGTKTLAEGIESKEQAAFLRKAHCHLGQGYHYSRPIPHEGFFERFIKGSELKL